MAGDVTVGRGPAGVAVPVVVTVAYLPLHPENQLRDASIGSTTAVEPEEV